MACTFASYWRTLYPHSKCFLLLMCVCMYAHVLTTYVELSDVFVSVDILNLLETNIERLDTCHAQHLLHYL